MVDLMLSVTLVVGDAYHITYSTISYKKYEQSYFKRRKREYVEFHDFSVRSLVFNLSNLHVNPILWKDLFLRNDKNCTIWVDVMFNHESIHWYFIVCKFYV